MTQVTIRFDREVAYGHLIESHFQINEKTVDEAGEAVPLQTIHEIKIGEDTTAKPSLLGEKNKTTLLPPLAEWQKGFCLVNSP